MENNFEIPVPEVYHTNISGANHFKYPSQVESPKEDAIPKNIQPNNDT